MNIWVTVALFVSLTIALSECAPIDPPVGSDVSIKVDSKLLAKDPTDSKSLDTLKEPESQTSPKRRKNGKPRRQKNKKQNRRQRKKNGKRSERKGRRGGKKNREERKKNRRNRRKKRCFKDSDCKQGKVCLIKRKKLARLTRRINEDQQAKAAGGTSTGRRIPRLHGKCRNASTYDTTIFQKISS